MNKIPVASSEGEQGRRLVIAMGPPKTASTSLQNFLATYMSNNNDLREGSSRIDAFSDWHYPLFFDRDNGFKELEKGYDHLGFPVIKNMVQNVSSSTNLVLASEYLINYKTWLDGNLWQELANWTGVVQPELVLVSRTPRTSHLVSIWKQLTQVPWKPTYGFSFQELICNTEASAPIERGLGTFSNPLGVAHNIIFSDSLPVYVLDSGGVAQEDMDICHAFCCSVLKVNCTDDQKWVRGLEGVTIRSNTRKGDPGLTREQVTQLDRLFQQRDCAYFADLRNHSMFHLLYRSNDLWPDDCSGSIRSVPAYRYNVTVMLEDFRRVLECPGYSHVHNGTNANESNLEAENGPLQSTPSTPPTVPLPHAQAPQTASSIILVALLGAFWFRIFPRGRLRSVDARVAIDHG